MKLLNTIAACYQSHYVLADNPHVADLLTCAAASRSKPSWATSLEPGELQPSLMQAIEGMQLYVKALEDLCDNPAFRAWIKTKPFPESDVSYVSGDNGWCLFSPDSIKRDEEEDPWYFCDSEYDETIYPESFPPQEAMRVIMAFYASGDERKKLIEASHAKILADTLRPCVNQEIDIKEFEMCGEDTFIEHVDKVGKVVLKELDGTLYFMKKNKSWAVTSIDIATIAFKK